MAVMPSRCATLCKTVSPVSVSSRWATSWARPFAALESKSVNTPFRVPSSARRPSVETARLPMASLHLDDQLGSASSGWIPERQPATAGEQDPPVRHHHEGRSRRLPRRERSRFVILLYHLQLANQRSARNFPHADRAVRRVPDTTHYPSASPLSSSECRGSRGCGRAPHRDRPGSRCRTYPFALPHGRYLRNVIREIVSGFGEPAHELRRELRLVLGQHVRRKPQERCATAGPRVSRQVEEVGEQRVDIGRLRASAAASRSQGAALAARRLDPPPADEGRASATHRDAEGGGRRAMRRAGERASPPHPLRAGPRSTRA